MGEITLWKAKSIGPWSSCQDDAIWRVKLQLKKKTEAPTVWQFWSFTQWKKTSLKILKILVNYGREWIPIPCFDFLFVRVFSVFFFWDANMSCDHHGFSKVSRICNHRYKIHVKSAATSPPSRSGLVDSAENEPICCANVGGATELANRLLLLRWHQKRVWQILHWMQNNYG